MENKNPNLLINEKSPYLLQHAYNPIDWYPWSEDAFIKARLEDKPIFLSIGYSTCHWCHIMEHESFEDDDVAKVLNDNFIAIKVDREERPDIDNIYMYVCQFLTGTGGWPLTIIMTPEKKPFFAGTYFPKNSKYGRTGLVELLYKIILNWRENREKLLNSSEYITYMLANNVERSDEQDITDDIIQKAYESLSETFDDKFGGFGNGTKFPIPHNLYFLLRYYYISNNPSALYMVEKTLESMYRGGIYDHIGFGFSRYSTDEKWLVPHFEKMLYDNALISIAYLEAFQVTGKSLYSYVAKNIFDYVLKSMTCKNGGFYSAEDADSEGIEGKFYVWEYEELKSVLGENDYITFCRQFNITCEGNFENKNIPNLIGSKNLVINENIRQKLFNYRENRIHPYKDDKILTSWNGLMIAAFAIGGRVLNDNLYIKAASNALEFIYKKLFNANGRLLARYRDGESSIFAYADDYSFLIWGLIELYLSTFNLSYLQKALALNEDLIKYFLDESNGGLFIYGNDAEQLISRPKEIIDGAIPSANSVSIQNWIKLSRITGNPKFEEYASKTIKYFSNSINYSPSAYTFFLSAYSYLITPSREIIIIGDLDDKNTQLMINATQNTFTPFNTVIVNSVNNNDYNNIIPFLSEYKKIENKPTAYVCKNHTCNLPTTNIDELKKQIAE